MFIQRNYKEYKGKRYCSILLHKGYYEDGKSKKRTIHAFLCMLSYYVILELKNRLKKLFSENGKGRDYKWFERGFVIENVQVCLLVPSTKKSKS